MWKEQNNIVTQWRTWTTSQISATFETGLTSNVAQEQDCARFTSEKHSTYILRASNTKSFSWSYNCSGFCKQSTPFSRQRGRKWMKEGSGCFEKPQKKKKGDAVHLYKQWQLLPTFVLLPWLFSHDWERFSNKNNKIKVTTKVLTVRKDFALLP